MRIALADSNEIHLMLGRMEGKTDFLINLVTNRFEDQESRIRTIEKRQYHLMGAGAVIGAILGNFPTIMKGLFR